MLLTFLILNILVIFCLIVGVYYAEGKREKYDTACSMPCVGLKYYDYTCDSVDPSGKIIEPVDNSMCTSPKPSGGVACNYNDDCPTWSCTGFGNCVQGTTGKFATLGGK